MPRHGACIPLLLLSLRLKVQQMHCPLDIRWPLLSAFSLSDMDPGKTCLAQSPLRASCGALQRHCLLKCVMNVAEAAGGPGSAHGVPFPLEPSPCSAHPA